MLSRISIQTQQGTLSMKTNNASLQLKSKWSSMHIEGNAPESLKMQKTYPKVKIDQSASFADIGMGWGDSLQAMDRYYAGMEKEGLKTIARIVADGVRYLQIERPGNPTVELAKQKMENLNNHELTIRAVQPPKITVEMGTLSITSDAKPTLPVQMNQSKNLNEYQRGKVDIAMKTLPSIDISVVPGTELSFPAAEGRRVDTTV